MKPKKLFTALILAQSIAFICPLAAQQKLPQNDVTAPLHLMQPEYPVPYGKPEAKDITAVLLRVWKYLDSVTPARVMDKKSKSEIRDWNNLTSDAVFAPGDYRLTSYEWGVTYSGMINAGMATGDQRFTDYTTQRLKLIAEIAPYFKDILKSSPDAPAPVRSVLQPRALDDSGALCAAMIRSLQGGNTKELRPLIDNFISYISNKQYRFPDGTLARNRPVSNSLWLDDLYMSVPALAQMGKLTGNQKYYDDAVKQILQFSGRMFNKEKGVYMHGWIQGMSYHQQYHWARANGWAVIAMVELLDVLPKNHAGYKAVLKQLQLHVEGLASYQDGTGFWHQLLDRKDSYLETSATAMYAYAIGRAVNKGFVDQRAFAPIAVLAWNAVSTKVNAAGQVEGTCVGTGMGCDPAFYYYRPVNVHAAHGYGPVMLAGAEILQLLKNFDFEINDSALVLKLR
jgi:unsaturated rhamnogalacturonyl hydrolase